MELKFKIDNIEYQIGVNTNNGGPRVERVDKTPINKMQVCKIFLLEHGWTYEMFEGKNTITLEKEVAKILLNNKDCNSSIKSNINFVRKNNIQLMKNKEINKDQLLKVIKAIVNEDITLKSNLKLENLLELKSAIQPINNLITLELTMKLIIKLKDIMPSIKDEKLESLLNEYELVNVNANGYDFKDDDIKIIAEVKGNKPYAGYKYGAAQLKELQKDVKGLLFGKSKANETNTNDYYKILAQLKYNKDNYDSRLAIESFIKNNEYCDKLKLLDDGEIIKEKDCVYIVLLEI